VDAKLLLTANEEPVDPRIHAGLSRRTRRLLKPSTELLRIATTHARKPESGQCWRIGADRLPTHRPIGRRCKCNIHAFWRTRAIERRRLGVGLFVEGQDGTIVVKNSDIKVFCATAPDGEQALVGFEVGKRTDALPLVKLGDDRNFAVEDAQFGKRATHHRALGRLRSGGPSGRRTASDHRKERQKQY
jgi:hypothetical protein